MTLEITNKIISRMRWSSRREQDRRSSVSNAVRTNGRKQWDPCGASRSMVSYQKKGRVAESGGGDAARASSHSITPDWLSRQLRQFRALLSAVSQRRLCTRERRIERGVCVSAESCPGAPSPSPRQGGRFLAFTFSLRGRSPFRTLSRVTPWHSFSLAHSISRSVSLFQPSPWTVTVTGTGTGAHPSGPSHPRLQPLRR